MVPMQLADSELQLDTLSEELTLWHSIYWAELDDAYHGPAVI